MKRDLGMETREIDVNMTARKIKINTVLICFSSKRYKGFLYATRKKLRTSNNPINGDLFINENLTGYNFDLLKKLKRERKSRLDSNCVNKIESVYTFDGKVFVKTNVSSISSGSLHIKNPMSLVEFIDKLNRTSV